MRIPHLVFLTAALALLGNISFSQTFDPSKRFFFGARGGINFTQPIPVRSFQVFSPTPGSTNGVTPKTYDPLKNNIGGQFGVMGMYYFSPFIALVFQPCYFNYNFNYRNAYSWQDTISGGPIAADYRHRYRLNYFELPVMLRYNILPNRFSPYIQGGGFIGVLHMASYAAEYSTSYDVPLQPGQDPPTTPSTSISQHINAFAAGVMGGVGICYNFDFMQIGIESNVRYGFIPITNPRNRFTDGGGNATGFYDVMDDIQLLNIELSLNVLFPIGYGSGRSSSKYNCSFQKKPKKYKYRRK